MAGSKPTPVLPPLPPGSEHVADWARRQGWVYQAHPDPTWFERWEPFDTMICPEAYYNAVSFTAEGSPGRVAVTLAEPWYAPVDATPLDRTVLAFVAHLGLVRHVAARGGEHFNTRVAYLETPPPPVVRLSDSVWNTHMLTFAASPTEAESAFPPAARRVLAEWGFAGHLEIRPGGLVLHHARLKPRPEHYGELGTGIARLVATLVSR